jgi:hypothetical protein
MHALHLPLRFGWLPERVYADLSNIVPQRYAADGALVPCETWDNATLSCAVTAVDQSFPMYVRTHRIAPGETNTWYLRIVGTRFSAEYSTKYPKTLRFMPYEPGSEQAWHSVDLGYESVYPAITGGIFEFGFTDAILQMWAAFCDQLTSGSVRFPCATPDETRLHHLVLTAALASQREGRAVALTDIDAPG